jgi:hypothetical protein
MNLVNDKNGEVSFFRISLLLLAIGVLVLVGFIIYFLVDQASYGAPLEVPLPSGAESWGTDASPIGGQRSRYYLVQSSSPEDIAAFFDQEMIRFYGSAEADPNRVRCQRQPAFGDFAGYVPGEGRVPYEFKCLFERSGFNVSRWTQVTIQPGVAENESAGATVIKIDQQWQG